VHHQAFCLFAQGKGSPACPEKGFAGMGEQVSEHHSFEALGDQGDAEDHGDEKSKDHGEHCKVVGKYKKGLSTVGHP
jgi:hypothetical protein